jgi:hypothetical protein
MTKKKTSFTLDADLLKDLKMKAVELGVSQTELIEKFIKQGLMLNKEINSLINDEAGTIQIGNINPLLFKKINKISEDEKISKEKVITDMIEDGIKLKTKNKIPEHLIANKDTYDPDPERLMSMSGIIEIDEPFDATEAIREMRNRGY